MNTMTWLQNGAAWAWHTSLMVAVPALVLVALGRWRGFSARWRMLFAAALLFRLLLPWVPELPGHPVRPLEHALVATPATPQAHEEIVLPSVSADAAPVASVVRPTIISALPKSFSWQGIMAVTWVVGVIGVGSWLASSHWLIRRWVSRHAAAPDAHVAHLFQWSCERMGLRRRIGLVEMPRMATAAVCGWLKPVVLVPANLRQTHTDDEIRGILLHELAHVRRCDVLWSWLGLAACALHWFNPLAWFALRRFHADRELECDRIALGNLSAPQRTAYAPALFKTLQCPSLTASVALVPFFRHKNEIHTRILAIMKPSRSLVARLAALLFIPALSILTLTTAGADEEKSAKTAPPETPALEKAPEETPVKRRDGELRKEGPREGELKKVTRDGEGEKKGPRDGELKKAVKDGDGEKKAPRDGELKKVVRDGEGEKKGPRDGELKKVVKDGDGEKKAPRDAEGIKKAETEKNSKALVLRVVGNGESVLVEGQTVAANALRGFLSEHVDGDSGTTIVVEAEDNVPYRAVLDVLDAARDSGARGAKLSMGDRPREGTKTKVP
jgi:beta-lactamase regulating signal transducer with metallopeptidase domain